MNNTLHTGGPWAIHTCNENGPFLDSFFLSTTAQTWDGNECERIICRFPTGTGQFSDVGRQNLANARLISAAPDLLSALETLLSAVEFIECQSDEGRLFSIERLHMGHDKGIREAKEAIAKAKGVA